MRASLDTAGERVHIDCSLQWVANLIAESAPGELEPGHGAEVSPTVYVRIESKRRAFDVEGWELLTRGAWRRDGEVVVEDACTSGFDVHLRCMRDRADFTFRWRPPPKTRAAAWVLRSRFHLLARAVLLQYPVMWRAAQRDRAPLHAPVCTAGPATALLGGAGGVGKSTLLKREVAAGGRINSDNVSVADGVTAWGLVEPLRIEGGPGRRMPHGRHEAPLPGRTAVLVPDRVIVLRRGRDREPLVRPCPPETAARLLTTCTYMAGELRRFWAFFSTLATGTGVGPAHPPVGDVAMRFADRLPAVEIVLGNQSQLSLTALIERLEVDACP